MFFHLLYFYTYTSILKQKSILYQKRDVIFTILQALMASLFLKLYLILYD